MVRPIPIPHVIVPTTAGVDFGFPFTFDLNLVTKKPRRIERVFSHKIGNQIRLACRQDPVSLPALNLIPDLGLIPADQCAKIPSVEEQIASRTRRSLACPDSM